MLSSPPLSYSLVLFSKLNISLNPPPITLRHTRFYPSSVIVATANRYTSKEEQGSCYLRPQGMASCTSLYEVLAIPVGAMEMDTGVDKQLDAGLIVWWELK
ncbi:hypothetical protein SLEP1_g46646 [Rubroshorea leprosula]|uniref:Uncharacterized protein n=1 Tax=Rubroshorea leprosula TaxID=152421 RepID=A0AAV5LQL2_9ROSI|nr:hypothetical protein SLEP1_g46646 [Rubroshorea leprosula]